MDVAKNVPFNARSYQSAYLKWYRYSEEIKTAEIFRNEI